MVGVIIVGGFGYGWGQAQLKKSFEKTSQQNLLISNSTTSKVDILKQRQGVINKQQTLRQNIFEMRASMEDPQIKIEKCKIISTKKSVKEAASLALQRIDIGLSMCNNDPTMVDKNKCFSNMISLADRMKNGDEEKLYEEYYLACLSSN